MPMPCDCKSDLETNSYNFDHMAESFMIVNSLLLIETFGYKACPIAFYGTVRIVFNSVYPLAAYGFRMRWARY